MSSLRLTDQTEDPHHLRLSGPRDVLEISAPLPGVLRLRHAPDALGRALTFPALPPKRSFAVLGSPGLALNVREDGHLLEVSAGGLLLTLSRRSGQWQVSEGAELLAKATDWDAAPGPVQGAYAPAAAAPPELRRTHLSLHAPEEAAYLGLGGRTGPHDRRGRRLTFWNTDAYQHTTEADPLYTSLPLLLTLRGGAASGLFVDEPWRMELDLARLDPGTLRWDSAGPELDVYVIAGPQPADVLRRYAELTGKAPLPPLWALGAGQSRWGYRSHAEALAAARGYRDRGLPLDALYLDIDYMDAYRVWTFDPARFPDPAATVRELRDLGVRTVPIVDPALHAQPGNPVYEEALAAGHLVQTARGEPLVGEVWPNPAVWPDLTRPEVVEWWAAQHRALTDLGVGGQWNDMNEPSAFSVRPSSATPGSATPGSATPVAASPGQGTEPEGKTLPADARHGERSHLEVHNAYANGMNEASRRAYREARPNERPWILSRAGYAGIQRFAGLWTGDNSAEWSHLAQSLPMIAGLGLSGVALAGADVGGFGGDTTGELLTRWYQAAVGYPFLRNHSEARARPQEPWRFGEPYLGHIREALALRYRLLPHLYTLVWQASQEGSPVLRPLAFHHPGDPYALAEQGAYLLGEGLLIAPVLRASERVKATYLPPGEWTELRGLRPLPQPRPGGAVALTEAPLGHLPIFLGSGYALPLTAPAERTGSAQWAELTWLIGPGEELSGTLYEDEGDGEGPWRLTRLSGRRGGGITTLRRVTEGSLRPARGRERLELCGFTSVRSVQHAQHYALEGGVLRLTLPSDWEEVVIRE